MKGIYFKGDRRLALGDFPVPSPSNNQVVLKVIRASICGSDMIFYKIPPDIWEDLTTSSHGGAPGIIPGIITGHEAAGIVEKIGPGVTNVKPGDRVTVYHHQGCGFCEQCLGGNMMSCPFRTPMGMTLNGSNSEYLLINARNCLPLPDELTYDDGAFMSCIAATAFSSLHKLQVSGRDVFAVYGLGPVGLTVGYMAKALGAITIGVEINDYRLGFAEDVGFDYVINSSQDDPASRIKELTNGLGVAKAVEASGSDFLRKMSAEVASVRGTVVLLGNSENIMDKNAEAPATFDSRFLIRKELRIQGSYVMPQPLYFEMCRFLINKKVNLSRLVTHRFKLDEAKQAYELFETGSTGKVMFDIHEE